MLRCLYWITLLIATLIHGINADKSSGLCSKSEFWNNDVAQCVPCHICKQYPKTPSCDTCPPIEPSDSWRYINAGPRGPYVNRLKRQQDPFIQYRFFISSWNSS
ncbi:hypothetical protein QQF64_004857 [Cirrhinus molitorella]|uniref:Uncharacterized protein n=1 Tax=Cirrhinus molitorella TaxID=172907 RepID=A0ABR3MHF8_9TELE